MVISDEDNKKKPLGDTPGGFGNDTKAVLKLDNSNVSSV